MSHKPTKKADKSPTFHADRSISYFCFHRESWVRAYGPRLTNVTIRASFKPSDQARVYSH